jgi:glycosyltransferase involved in cell wall biosynthesis
VLGHLRPVKDPFRTAEAARLLPASSRIRVLHAGAALSPAMEHQARAEEAINSRYRWLEDLPRWKALRLLARSRLLVLTSLMEGGANTISEAIAAGVPVLASRIPGSVGLLGTQYPGYFPVGDTAALAALLTRAETDTKFYILLPVSSKKRSTQEVS